MIDTIETEDTNQKKIIKEDVQHCIRTLLEHFWIIKADSEAMYYLVKDNEAQIKAFFRDTFRYRLIMTHELVKLEKIPVTLYNWMGDKEVKGQTTFKRQRDFVFFFCLLAFMEGKGKDDQFSLQNICEAIQAYYPQQENAEHITVTWKEGAGYKNRLSLVRVLKYAIKMRLLVDVDQYIEDFAADAQHDVLFERTPYVSNFIRGFKDVFTWQNYHDFTASLTQENHEQVDRKHRFYRRLFMEPIVYHHDITEDEQDYIKRFYQKIEENIARHTGFEYERYQHNSLLVKTVTGTGEVIHPAENMRTSLILRFAGFLLTHRADYAFNFMNEVELSNNEMQRILSKLKESDGRFWSKSFKQMSSEQLRINVTDYLINWNFAERKDDRTLIVKEGLFRIVGDYTEPKEEKAHE